MRTLGVLVAVACVVLLAGCGKQDPTGQAAGEPGAGKQATVETGTATAAAGTEPGAAAGKTNTPGLPLPATRGGGAEGAGGVHVQATTSEVGKAAAGTEPGASAQITPLEDLPALAALPSSTLLVAAATDVPALLDRLGRVELIERFRDQYEKAVAEVTQEVGYNLLDPKAYADMGIDIAAPAGFAWLSLEPLSMVAFVKLTDPEKLKTALYSIAGRSNEKLEPHVAGSAIAICPRNDEEICFIIRDGYAFFHAVDAGDEKGLELALAFASAKPEPSLAKDAAVRSSLKRLAFGKDVALYFNSAALVAQTEIVGPTRAEEYAARTRAELEEAKKAGDAQRIAEIEQRLKYDEEWVASAKRQQEEQKKMLRLALSEMGAVSMGVNLLDSEILFKVIADAKPTSPALKLVRALPGPSLLARTVPDAPMYFAHVNMDLPAYLEMLASSLEVVGFRLDDMKKEIKAGTGLDLDTDVLPALSGELGFSISADMATMMESHEKYLASVSCHILIGIASNEKAAALLDRLAAIPMASALVKNTPDGLDVSVPEWRTVHVRLSDKYLTASTWEGFAAAVAEGASQAGGKPFLAKVDNPGLKAAFESKDISAIAALDFGFLGAFFFYAMDVSYNAMAVPEPASASPLTEGQKAKKAELDRLTKEIEAKRKDINDRKNKATMRLVERLGTMVISSRLDGNTLVVEGHHFPGNGTVKASIVGAAADVVDIESAQRGYYDEVWKLEDKKYELQRQIDEMGAKPVGP